MNADASRGARNFVNALMSIVLDQTSVRRASTCDLAVIEGVLKVILETVSTELKRRDDERAASGVRETRPGYGLRSVGG